MFGKNGVIEFGRGCTIGTADAERLGAAVALHGPEIAITDASTSTTRTYEKPLTPLPATRIEMGEDNRFACRAEQRRIK